MTEWKIEKINKIPKLKDTLFIEGLPGISNIGKITTDLIVEQL